MNDHKAAAVVITCIDFRFQEYIDKWIAENLTPKSFDRVAFAGCVKNFDTILGQIEISKRLHDIKKVILINHEDCGAYGEAGTHDKHAKDLNNATKEIKTKFPDLEVKTYFLRLDGNFEEIS